MACDPACPAPHVRDQPATLGTHQVSKQGQDRALLGCFVQEVTCQFCVTCSDSVIRRPRIRQPVICVQSHFHRGRLHKSSTGVTAWFGEGLPCRSCNDRRPHDDGPFRRYRERPPARILGVSLCYFMLPLRQRRVENDAQILRVVVHAAGHPVEIGNFCLFSDSRRSSRWCRAYPSMVNAYAVHDDPTGRPARRPTATARTGCRSRRVHPVAGRHSQPAVTRRTACGPRVLPGPAATP